jgi:chromosome segregation ATPase
VIQFALLFGLGFLTAALLVFLIAPAIHRRIVWFTEKRLKATMPLSPQEVRAQKDMARALFAAENARTEHALTQERDKTVALQIQNGKLQQEASRLSAASSELQTRIDDLEVEAGELRSRLRHEESYISQLKSSIHAAEQANAEKEADIDSLRKRMTKMGADADNLRIDLAARETEIESLKLRINTLRDERDTLRQDLNAANLRATDAEQSLRQESDKNKRLEERLNREIAGNADKETAIERHAQDVVRLRERLEAAIKESKEAGKALRSAGLTPPRKTAKTPKLAAASIVESKADEQPAITEPPQAMEPERTVEDEIALMTEEVRNRAAALSDRLLKARTPAHDDAMREEIAKIAANMVALTALKEGDGSPIFNLLPKDREPAEPGARISLADRVAAILPKHP